MVTKSRSILINSIVLQSDLAEMRSRDSTYQGYRARDVFQTAPIPDFLKMQLFNLIRSCSHPALKDPVVFMLMFKDPDNVETNHISNQYWRRRRARRMTAVLSKWRQLFLYWHAASRFCQSFYSWSLKYDELVKLYKDDLICVFCPSYTSYAVCSAPLFVQL